MLERKGLKSRSDHLVIIYRIIGENPPQLITMYTYLGICSFSEKTIKTYVKLEISVVCREFIAFKYIFIFFQNKLWMIIYICTSEVLKTHV